MRYIAVIFFMVLSLGFAQEPPEALLQQGITALKASDRDHSQLVEAARLLTLASQGFEAAGNDPAAAEANSLLYWTKKRMTLDDANLFQKKDAKTAEKAEAIVVRKIEVQESVGWLKKADEYAQVTADPLLKAIRYFEVAERFKGTPEGMTALDQSLKLMKELANTGNGNAVDAAKVVGAASKGDGKVYVQSSPTGANILVEAEDGLRDTGSKTPALVQLPKGNVKLVLRKEKYEDAKVSVQIGDAIVKTEVVKLEMPKVDVEILSVEAGWRVFLLENNKPVSLCDKAGKQAVTPCTVCLEEGAKTLVLAKEGFRDQSRRVTAGKDAVVNFERKGVVGQSLIVLSRDNLIGKYAGKYIQKTPYGNYKIILTPSGQIVGDVGNNEGQKQGTWVITNDGISLSWDNGKKQNFICQGQNFEEDNKQRLLVKN